VTLAAAAQIATRLVGDTSLTNKRLVSSTPCTLYAVTGVNSGPDQYLLVFETNALPANGSAAKICVPVLGAQFYSIDFSCYGAGLDKVYVACSTTTNTLTLGSSNITVTAIIGPRQ
jgi:hypothetical protein